MSRALLSLSAALLLSTPAHSRNGVRLTDSLTLQYRTIDVEGSTLDPTVDKETERSYFAVINRLNIQGSADNLTTFARVDAMTFFDAPTFQPEQPGFADDVRLERLRVRYRIGDWTLVAGDYFEQLGRGIVLSIRKVDELGVDLEIRGGRAEYDGDAVGATIFAGRVNPANLDTVSERFLEDSDDVMVGSRVSVRAIDGVDFGLIGLHLRPETQTLGKAARDALDITEDDQNTGGGVFFEIADIADIASFYGEADYQQKTIAGEDSTGRAAYGTVNFTFENLNILAEGMFLDEYEVRGSPNTVLGQSFSYNQVPTIERFDQIVDNLVDFTGGRLFIEPYVLDGNLIFHVNGMLRINDPGEDAEIQQIHAYGGAKYAYNGGRSRVELSGGYRDETKVNGDRFRDMTHFEVDWLQALGSSTWAVHLQSRNELRSQETPDPENPFLEFFLSSTLLSVEKASVASLTLELGVDTQDQSDGTQQVFYAGIVDMHLDAAIKAMGVDQMEPVLLRATVGDQRGGIKCIGGICRDFPAFSGAKISIVARHTLGG